MAPVVLLSEADDTAREAGGGAVGAAAGTAEGGLVVVGDRRPELGVRGRPGAEDEDGDGGMAGVVDRDPLGVTAGLSPSLGGPMDGLGEGLMMFVGLSHVSKKSSSPPPPAPAAPFFLAPFPLDSTVECPAVPAAPSDTT